MMIAPGMRFGRWTVIGGGLRRQDPYRRSTHLVRCRCDCGTVALVRAFNLGRTSNSCGCLRRERVLLGVQRRCERAHGTVPSP